ncbi:MAG: hypothetical protein RIS47_972 [Bacteroidota bacterium]
MKTEIKWGILGTGFIARKMAEALAFVPNAKLYAIASRNLDTAQKFADEFAVVKAYGSYEELAADPEIDLVYIGTPHPFHFPNTMMCLEQGKGVLCEKPFAMNRMEVDLMVESARSKNLFLMEAFWTRFLPHFRFLETSLDSGKIGTITKIEADFGVKSTFDPDGRFFNKDLGGGALLDIGIYPCFLPYFILGQPDGIEATATIGETDVDISDDIIFHYPDGQVANLQCTFLEETPTEATILGSDGSFRLHHKWFLPTTITHTDCFGNEEHLSFPHLCNGYEYEAIEATECMLSGITESELMPHEFSQGLISLLDSIREIQGVNIN